MANGKGGARPGAGRPKKPLAEKIVDGQASKAKVLNFGDEMKGEDMPEPNKYLYEQTKGASENTAQEIYEKTWRWLKERKCDIYVQPNLVEQYAICVARHIQAEEAIHTYGFLAKHPTTGVAITSPFIRISHEFLKQSNAIWNQIYLVIKENCADFYTNASDGSTDVMEQILNSRPKRGNNGN